MEQNRIGLVDLMLKSVWKDTTVVLWCQTSGQHTSVTRSWCQHGTEQNRFGGPHAEICLERYYGGFVVPD